LQVFSAPPQLPESQKDQLRRALSASNRQEPNGRRAVPTIGSIEWCGHKDQTRSELVRAMIDHSLKPT
jgi:hypothetical protein